MQSPNIAKDAECCRIRKGSPNMTLRGGWFLVIDTKETVELKGDAAKI